PCWRNVGTASRCSRPLARRPPRWVRRGWRRTRRGPRPGSWRRCAWPLPSVPGARVQRRPTSLETKRFASIVCAGGRRLAAPDDWGCIPMTVAAGEADVQPFRAEIPQSDLDALQQRLALTTWPDELPGVDWSYGVPLDHVRELVDHWRTGYDWRANEA